MRRPTEPTSCRPAVGRRALILGTAGAAFAALLLPGCDDPPRRPTPPPTGTQPAGPAAADQPMEPIDFAALSPTDPTPARPGYLTGRVLDADGKPVRRPGVRIVVLLAGVGDDASDLKRQVEAAADGTFAEKLKPGTYTSVNARIEFPFEGHTYRLPLVPTVGALPRQTSAFGVVQDFTWKLTGLRPGSTPDPEKPEPWIGGSIRATYRGISVAERRPLRSAPPGTTLRFTLAPTGPLADGRRGDPIVVTRQYDPSGSSLDRPLLNDLPLTRFAVSGVEERPDGSRRPVLFLQADSKTWAETLEGTFTPDVRAAAVEAKEINFTRQEN